MEATEVSERMKVERDGASERYHQMLSSIRQIGKERDERKNRTVDTLTKLFLVYEEG